jgi:hypothetical protein
MTCTLGYPNEPHIWLGGFQSPGPQFQPSTDEYADGARIDHKHSQTTS